MKPTAARVLGLEIGCRCNNRCYFCRSIDFSYSSDDQSLISTLESKHKEGFTEVVITGHEPTLSPSLPRIIQAAREIGYNRIRLETNARMLSYEKFARSLMEAGLTEAAILVPAHTSEMYEKITSSPEGFSQCEAGVRNMLALKSPNFQVSAAIPVCRMNLFSLNDIVRYCYSLGLRRCMFAIIGDDFTHETEYRFPVADAMKDAEGLGMFVEMREGERLVAILGAEERRKESLKSLFDISYCYLGEKKWILGGTIMVDYHCNQQCSFCTVNNKLPPPPEQMIKKYIRYASQKNYPRMVFTGGEPTLHASIPDFIAAAHDGGIPEVWLFTNAIRLADEKYAGVIKKSGLDLALVSLHAPTAEVSDEITSTPGSFNKTVQGIHNLLKYGVYPTLSVVINAKNYVYLVDYVDFVYENFGKIPINFSFVTPIFDRTVEAGMMPRYTDAVPCLMEALRRCGEKGIPTHGLEPHWGIPPCALPDISDYYGELYPIRGSGIPRDFMKKQICTICRFDKACHGVRRLYANTYGLDEIKAVKSFTA